MAKMSYSEQLRHPNWQRRRLEIMEASGFECENCGDKETTLNVHHRLYVKGRMVWDYDDQELACLCEPCHRQEHEHREFLDQLLACGSGRLASAIGLLAGYLSMSMNIDAHEEEIAKRIAGDEFLTGATGAMVTHGGCDSAVLAIEASRTEECLNPAESCHLALLRSMRNGGDESA